MDEQEVMQIKRQIIVTTEWKGFHSWEDAPDEVRFLSNTHRHKFKCKMALPVTHNDRDKEFFMVQRRLDGYIEGTVRLSNKSCEQYAEMILCKFNADYVEVWEDGENGARVEKVNK